MSEQPYDAPPRSAKKKWLIALLLLIGLPLVGYYGFAAWRHAAMHVSTDNAYVQADMAQITPRVHGTVIDVLVQENWWVKPGQALVRLDTRDYEVQLAEAKAALTRARESVDQLFAAVAVAGDAVANSGGAGGSLGRAGRVSPSRARFTARAAIS